MKPIIKNISSTGEVTLFLYGEVSDEPGDGKVSSREIVEELSAVDRMGADTITIRVNSIGGDVYPGIAIFSAIRRCKAKVTVAVDGIAASIAGIIALAADRIEIGKYARIMIHNVLGGGYGNKRELKALIEQIESLEENISKIISERTGMTPDEIRSTYFEDGKDHWLNADEAIALHLADAIYDEDPVPEEATGNEIYNIFTNRLQASMQSQNNPKKMFEDLKKKNPRFANCETEEDVAAKVAELEAENEELKTQAEQEAAAKVTAEVDAAVKDGRIGEDQREIYTNLLKSDYQNGSKALSLLKPRNRAKNVIENGNRETKQTPWEARMDQIRNKTEKRYK